MIPDGSREVMEGMVSKRMDQEKGKYKQTLCKTNIVSGEIKIQCNNSQKCRSWVNCQYCKGFAMFGS